MDATFRYDVEEVGEIVKKEHEKLWPAPPGFKWETKVDGYASRAIKFELVKVEEEKAEEEKP